MNHQRILGGENSPIESTIDETQSISLNHNQGSFSIGFTSIDFRHCDLGKFIWKLEGFDKDWVEEQEGNQATYTNLNGGDYKFHLRMIDEQGKPLAENRTIEISIAMPLWRTPLAFIGYAVVLLLAIVLFIFLNKLRLESKRAENRLHLLVEMAHEVKTPLTLIKAPLADLMADDEVNTDVKESVNVALASADKLLSQMRQFLDFRNIGTKRENLQYESVDLVHFLKEKLFAYQVLAERKMISLQFEQELSRLTIQTDLQILDKVISNLISNAIKYTLENGRVDVQLKVDNSSWSLSVIDSGVGIPKSERKKIFKLFYRTEKGKETGSTGSGVGLILARDFCHALGGKLVLVDSSVKGSHFMVTIPFQPLGDVAERAEDAMEDNNEASDTVSGSLFTIMLAEDNKELREYETSRLRKSGYHVIAVSDGMSAMNSLKVKLPDLVISDVIMPKINGFQLCMNIKSAIETCHIPVILLTGQESKEHILQGIESGADDYITKPFDFDVLDSKIQSLIKTRALLKENFVSNNSEATLWEGLSNEYDQEFIRKSTDFVMDNINDTEYSVDALCGSMGMSRSTFYHKIKLLLDVSPADFIRTIRLNEAKKLLMHPKYNVSEVAYKTGFVNAKYFSTIFKKHCGETPSTFIARHQSEKTV